MEGALEDAAIGEEDLDGALEEEGAVWIEGEIERVLLGGGEFYLGARECEDAVPGLLENCGLSGA